MRNATGKSGLRAARRSMIAVVAMGLVTTAGLAPLSPALAASEADKDACTPDVWRLCSGQIPVVSAIVACLNRKIERLSPDCRAVMQGGSERTARRRQNR